MISLDQNLLFKYLNCHVALMWWGRKIPARNVDCASTTDIWWKEV